LAFEHHLTVVMKEALCSDETRRQKQPTSYNTLIKK